VPCSFTGDPDKRRYAEKLSGLIAPERHHLLLVTLLLINAACMESVPLFLDRLVPPWLAILLSVSFVLIFGEILPQALCSANPLKIGATLSPLVWAFIFLTFPLSWPIAKLLDRVLGHDGKHFLSGNQPFVSFIFESLIMFMRVFHRS
jgi:metal transporter CNNM